MILTDVDGVLLDWFSGFRSYLRGLGFTVKDGDPESWSMKGWTSTDDLQPLIRDFNSSWRFERLPHYIEARSQLRKLFMEGHDIVAVTSCSSDGSVHAMRQINLNEKFGPIFKEVICLPLMADKTPILKQFPHAFWIEDSLHGAKAGIDAGHRTFLLNKPYNQENIDPNIERVEDWDQIYERISKSSRT